MGRGALYCAAQAGHLAMVRQLLERNADANACTTQGARHSPLTIAAYETHEAVCELLLTHGADPLYEARPADSCDISPEPYASANFPTNIL